MEKGNPNDPLLRQVLPLAEELLDTPGFDRDPTGDLEAASEHGLLRKYQGRALLITTGACAIHCRYCFRRNFPYSHHQARRKDWPSVRKQLSADPAPEELILSGGDPLLLDDTKVQDLVAGLATVPTLQRLRIHTRLPVVLPSRITPALCEILTNHRLPTVMVIHANHPRELGSSARNALARLRRSGVHLLNQSVLLRGVNDSAELLRTLSETLFESGVIPYYLHQLDRVQGGAHFEVRDAEAKRLLTSLRATLPGYLVPRLVREEKGQPAKLPLV